MARTANPERPKALLDSVAGYLVSHGVADVSVRDLAKGVGSSPRVLLYYFGSKEALIAGAFSRLRDRQRAALSKIKLSVTGDSGDLCRTVWRQMSAPESEPFFRLFIQAYSTGIQDPERHGKFLRDTIDDWLNFLAAPRIARGQSPSAARAFATVVLAGFRGFLLDYCASRNRKRVDAAVDLWVRALDTIPLSEAPTHERDKPTRRRTRAAVMSVE
jgi:AcrR family transcriptional regulator